MLIVIGGQFVGLGCRTLRLYSDLGVKLAADSLSDNREEGVTSGGQSEA
jgi:hypothetical protein